MRVKWIHSLPAVLCLATIGTSISERPCRAAATLQVKADAAASAADDFSNGDAPPTADSGAQPIGALPFSVLLPQSAQASARYTQGIASAVGEIDLTLPGAFAGALIRATVSAVARASGNSASPEAAAGSSRAEAVYRDVLTAGGLPPGSPVTLRVRLDLDALIGHIGANNPCTAELSFRYPGDALPRLAIVDADQEGGLVRADSLDVVVMSGVPTAFELRLVAQASATASTPGNFEGSAAFNTVSGEFRINPHRGRMFVDVVTAGASYNLESGADLRSRGVTLGAAQPSEPGALVLAAPRPNPARGPVRLDLDVPAGGAHGRWRVIDAGGREVAKSAGLAWTTGRHAIEWTGADASGRALPAGVYFLRVETDRGVRTQRIARID